MGTGTGTGGPLASTPGAPGADMGDRALSMARMANKGAAADLAGGLQSGDVSFTFQKKVSTAGLLEGSLGAK